MDSGGTSEEEKHQVESALLEECARTGGRERPEDGRGGQHSWSSFKMTEDNVQYADEQDEHIQSSPQRQRH